MAVKDVNSASNNRNSAIMHTGFSFIVCWASLLHSCQAYSTDSAYGHRADLPQGINRYFEFNVSRSIIAPDGVERHVILANGQYPGPLIEADYGDTVHGGHYIV
jgi:hypothetical protein